MTDFEPSGDLIETIRNTELARNAQKAKISAIRNALSIEDPKERAAKMEEVGLTEQTATARIVESEAAIVKLDAAIAAMKA